MVQLGRNVKPLLKIVPGLTATRSNGEACNADPDVDRSPEDSPYEPDESEKDTISINNSKKEQLQASRFPQHSIQANGSCSSPGQIASNDEICRKGKEYKKRKINLCQSPSSGSDDEIGNDVFRSRRPQKLYSSSQYKRKIALSSKNPQSLQMDQVPSVARKAFKTPNSVTPKKLSGLMGEDKYNKLICNLGGQREKMSKPPSPPTNHGLVARSRSSPLRDQINEDSYSFSWSKRSCNVRSAARCPLCKSDIDVPLLRDFERGTNKSFRQKEQFCLLHRKLEAQSRWSRDGYPNIDWDAFDQRLFGFHRQLNNILEGQTSSHYRNILEDEAAHKKAHKLLSDLEALERQDSETGYYGKRGSRRMMEHVVANFSAKIRRFAASDKMIIAIGIPGFAQFVLVSELRVMLTMEDFTVCAEDARTILKNSKELGDLLCDEEDEQLDYDPNAETNRDNEYKLFED